MVKQMIIIKTEVMAFIIAHKKMRKSLMENFIFCAVYVSHHILKSVFVTLLRFDSQNHCVKCWMFT